MSYKYQAVDNAVSALERFYRKVDTSVAQIAAQGGVDLQCAPGCVSCCMDGISVFWIEAENIMQKRAALLFEKPHEPGACAFLDQSGLCRIYDVRPYVCRTQGLALRWIGEDSGSGPAEMRDICPKNDPGPALLELPVEACWEIGPHESILAGIQAGIVSKREECRLLRVSLRRLFEE